MDSDVDLEENSLLDEYDNSDLPIETCSEEQPQLAVPVTHSIESVHQQGSLNSTHAIPPGLMENTSKPANCSSMSTTKSRLQSPDSNLEITTTSAYVKISNKKSPSGSLVPVCPGSSSVCPVGGSVSVNTAHGTRQASGDEVLQMVGAFVTEAEKSDFDFSLEKREEGHSKEVHVHLTKTDIHQPAAVSFGGQVHVGSPQEQSATQNNGETVVLKKLREKTERTFKEWTEGMVRTKATRTILNKVDQGITWVTVTGCPGEGKTTAGYLVLKHFHDRGREVFDVKIPDDYFKAKEVKHPVIMLNDIFGALTFDSDSFKKWQNVLSDVLALSEHKHEERKRSNKTQNQKKPELTVILISRLSILKEASRVMGRFKHLVLKEENMVDLTETVILEQNERADIWKHHAEQYDIIIDSKTVTEVCRLTLSHGFPHCCRLFAAMYKKNRKLNMSHFFSMPIEFLNQSMESLMVDSLTGSLLREMLKNDGTLNLNTIANHEKRNKYLSVAETLMGTYLMMNGREITFHHPSVYDSAAFCICQVDPQFVIFFCSLSFLNERVRLQDLSQDDTIESHHTVSIDNAFENLLLERFLTEFHTGHISAVMSHASFNDEGFVLRFIQTHFSFSTKLSRSKYVKYKISKFLRNALPSKLQTPISQYLKDLFHVFDIKSFRSFLFLMTKSGSDKLLRYIHQYVELTEDEQKETLFGICEHSAVSSLGYLLQKYKNINLEITDQYHRTPLLVCTLKGSQDMIKQLLKRNVNVNAMDYEGRTPLLNICTHGVDGDGAVVKMLVEKGATFERIQSTHSPLGVACQEGQTNVIRALLDMGVDVNITDRWGNAPLHEGCRTRHICVVSALLEKGAYFNTKNISGDTPLYAACLNGYVDVVLLLLNQGANVDIQNGSGNTPLYAACWHGYIDVVSVLLEKGAYFNTKNICGDTPLYAACLNGYVDVVLLLLNQGANVDIQNGSGNTPLYAACWHGYVDVVSVLLEKGACINIKSKTGNTPLQIACSEGHMRIVSSLIEKGADVNISNIAGYTPLHSACVKGYIDMVLALIENGADINKTNMNDETHLHAACSNGYVDIVSVLLDKGADVNTTNSAGDTPLHKAVICNKVDLVLDLLDKGADVIAKNIKGNSPLHKACLYSNLDVILTLLKNGADVNMMNINGYTPLHAACLCEKFDVVSALLENGADVDMKSRNGTTPLHAAIMFADTNIVQTLFNSGANVNTTNRNSDSPLHTAVKNLKFDVVKQI